MTKPSFHVIMGTGWDTHLFVGWRDSFMLTVGLPMEWPNWSSGRVACGPVSLTYWPWRTDG